MPADIGILRSLFIEYIGSLGVDLAFQDVDAELADLPGTYAAPAGIILIARDCLGEHVGCCALRPLPEPGACEMKRLYVRPTARGVGVGHGLVLAAIERAGSMGYKRMLLDTLPDMIAARALYAGLGFRATEAYCHNPIAGTTFMVLDLCRL